MNAKSELNPYVVMILVACGGHWTGYMSGFLDLCKVFLTDTHPGGEIPGHPATQFFGATDYLTLSEVARQKFDSDKMQQML